MSRLVFDTFFRSATGNLPYGYQSRLAGGDAGTQCRSQLINIPTGLGKTAAAVLAWLWNRLSPQIRNSEWPRRLVYCLPMRTLVEQTRDNVQLWLLRIALAATENDSPERAEIERQIGNISASINSGANRKAWIESIHAPWGEERRPIEAALASELKGSQYEIMWLAKQSPIILMGGEDAERDWDIHPENPAILIGTQDMLLSRALNRGYGMSRYRWPMHFGLLNNDCLWVMDETQLMGVSVETSAQLDGFRHDHKWSVFAKCPTWWMSATLEDSRLATVDHRKPDDSDWPYETLTDAEKAEAGRPRELFDAKKSVARCERELAPATKNDYAKQLAALVVAKHQPGTLTLVVVNRVGRAQQIYEALTKPDKKTKQPLYEAARVALVHSRFRRLDRQRHEELLFDTGDRIVIATQAVEAGVDVSARLLVTELAPWSSLVQRIGRCNRRAEFSDAEVLWVDIKSKDDNLLRPYRKDDLDKATKELAKITDASPRSLAGIAVAETPVVRPVIRRGDIVDLFDTTPDICGQDLDISRYIRDEQDNDVQFFWRSVAGDAPAPGEKPPQRNELCRVSIGDAVEFLGKKPRAWRWNPLDEKWEAATSARPGAVYLLDLKSGGYSEATGWTGESGDKPTPLPPPDEENERYCGDRRSFIRQWQTIAEHTTQVVAEMRHLASTLALADAETAAFITAAQWHDVGKSHVEFQNLLKAGGPPPRDGQLWAKSANKDGKCARRGFRHELASAIAWLLADTPHAPGKPGSAERDLVAYLIAAHHGRVRLSIRSLPDEAEPTLPPMPDGEDRPFARGIWHQHERDAEKHDVLPPVSLGEFTTPEVPLDLSFMKMGAGPYGPSWLARAIALRDKLGPFRLAYLETLLRAVDARASAIAEHQNEGINDA